MYSKLEEYILNWKGINEIKPVNEDTFLYTFIDLLNTYDECREVSFDGEGSYFGKQISFDVGSYYGGRGLLDFEIAYSRDKISVYDGRNNGYWVPEYICLDNKDERFKDLKNALSDFLNKMFGMDFNI